MRAPFGIVRDPLPDLVHQAIFSSSVSPTVLFTHAKDANDEKMLRIIGKDTYGEPTDKSLERSYRCDIYQSIDRMHERAYLIHAVWQFED